MKRVRLVLMRHSTPESTDLLLGQADIPLATSAIRRTQLLGMYFRHRGYNFDRIYCSELMRSIETAYALNFSKEIISDARINEIDLGKLNGTEFTTTNTYYITKIQDDHGLNNHCGESVEKFLNRIGEFLGYLLEHSFDNDNVLVVTHEGVMRAILSDILEIYPRNATFGYLGTASLEFIAGEDGIVSTRKILLDDTPVTGWKELSNFAIAEAIAQQSRTTGVPA